MTDDGGEWIPEPPRDPDVSDQVIGCALLFVAMVSFVWGVLVGATSR